MSNREEFDKDEERILDLLAKVCLANFLIHSVGAALIPPSLKGSRFASYD